MQRDLSYAQAIGSRAASRQVAAAAEPAGEARAAAAGAAAGGASQQGATRTAASGAACDRSGPADVPKLTFTIDGYPMSPTTTIFQAVEVRLPAIK